MQRQEFWFWGVETTICKGAQQLSEISFLIWVWNENSYLQATVAIDKLTISTHNCEKAGNDAITIFTSEDMENMPLGSQM